MYAARIIARQGKTYIVEDQSSHQHQCHARSQTMDAVCGDHVSCQPQESSLDVIEEILPRQNQITRVDNFKRKKTLAANVDHMFIVISPIPEFSTLLIDKYLACAQLNHCKASIIINKSELIYSHGVKLNQLESIYKDLVKYFIVASAKLGYGISTLRKALSNETSILVGQSGVGKSSIINRLLNSNDIKVNTVSDQIQQGRHTTSNAYAYPINDCGNIIDSPGVRTFTPAFADQDELISGFAEFEPFTGKCKFNDCKHLDEPGCAVRQAVSENIIHPSRYDNYLQIRRELPEL